MNKALRRHHSERVIKNRIKLVKLIDPIKDWLDHPHRFNKKKPYDCGKSHCTLCHSEKFWNKKDKTKYIENNDLQLDEDFI